MAAVVTRFDDLAEVYDLMVNWEARLAREAPFFDRLFAEHGVKFIIDAACGTGRHAVHFAQRGLQVIGTDLSGAMIRQARRFARERGVKVPFLSLAFDRLGARFNGQADGVVCLGNSLAACGSASAARTAMRNFARSLRPGGLVVIQILDFDGMRAKRDRFEPPRAGTKDGVEYLLFKFFDLARARVTLNLNIFTRRPGEAWSWRVVSNDLYAPGAAELGRLARDTGFGRIQLYANHRFEPYRRQADQLLLTAAKK